MSPAGQHGTGHEPGRGRPEERARLVPDDGLATGDFVLALPQVIRGDFLEIINVVKIDVLQEFDLRVNVARHGDVNQKQRPVLARLHQRLQPGAVQDVMRRRGAADDDVNAGKFGRPILKADGPAAQFRGQRRRRVRGSGWRPGCCARPG